MSSLKLSVQATTDEPQRTKKMEEKPGEVVLLGAWSSPYCARVVLALKLKGIPYTYVEEDLASKSKLLLQHNPVHKKVPVLLHKGKAIVESLVILEYIEENWKHSPKLLAEDPYQRAKIRFWVNYFDQKIMPASYPIIQSKGEQRKKAMEEMNEMIRVFEQGIKEDFPDQFPSFKGENLGLLEIVVGANSCNYQAFQEVSGIEIIGPEKCPEFFAWLNALKEHPLMKESLPPQDKLVARMKQKLLQSQKV